MQATLFTLRSASGVEASVTDYGAALTHLRLPAADGTVKDCVLGFDDLRGYRGKDNPYFGAIVGRVANRIAGGKFRVEGQEYSLATNNGPNHLHGGVRGFDKVLWDAEEFSDPAPGVRFTYVSADGEEGYPGECRTQVTYTLFGNSTLKIDMESTVSKACPVNLANHAYFNLCGHDAGEDVLGHRLHINADRYTPTDATSIPTGELAPVEGTPFDFRARGAEAHTIGERIGELKGLPGSGGGYDHNYVLNGKGFGVVSHAATVVEPKSGRRMDL